MHVEKQNENEWNQRLTNLENQIKYWSENKSEKTIEVVELYYDEDQQEK